MQPVDTAEHPCCADATAYKIADCLDEVRAALTLVHESYLKAGLTRETPHRMRITPWHLLPTTEVFVAARDGEVVGTLSLVRDGELGIPMESLYPDEVAARRLMGMSMAEVSCLADRRSGLEQGFGVVMRLMSLMAQAALRRGVDTLLIVVHPRHARFYQRYIGFDVIGDRKTYAAVCGNPAVALELDLRTLSLKYPKVHETFFGNRFPEASLRPQPLAREIKEFLRCVYAEASAVRPRAAADATALQTVAI